MWYTTSLYFSPISLPLISHCSHPSLLLTLSLSPLPSPSSYLSLLLSYGAPVTWQSAVFMWWAGLRGAVGLALGIQFYRSDTGSFHLQSDAAQVKQPIS